MDHVKMRLNRQPMIAARSLRLIVRRRRRSFRAVAVAAGALAFAGTAALLAHPAPMPVLAAAVDDSSASTT